MSFSAVIFGLDILSSRICKDQCMSEEINTNTQVYAHMHIHEFTHVSAVDD